MAFFNLGNKDQYGKQRRIEHRGKNLRVSRTGGVAMRAQAKAAGLTVTGNTTHGLRVSSRVASGTQVAVQNGRLVLRGRYGRGPTRLNLSKSGVSLSTRNPIGTFNWMKPNRSSVKIAGVQLRGKKAANIQLIYMLSMLVGLGLILCLQVLSFIFKGIALLLTGVWHWLTSIPQQLNAFLQRRRSAKLAPYLERAAALFTPPISDWTATELQAGLLLVLTGWGRGLTAQEALARLALHQSQQTEAPPLAFTSTELADVAQRLESTRTAQAEHMIASPQTITALLAQQHHLRLTAEETVEALLSADDWVVALDQRTVLQEQLVQIFSDFAQVRLQAEASLTAELNEQSSAQTQNQAQQPALREQQSRARGEFGPTWHNAKSSQRASFSSLAPPRQSSYLVNLNTASHAQLQTLPHIGFDRALDIITLRPFTHVSQLTAIKGIGPARLADIQRAGVTV